MQPTIFGVEECLSRVFAGDGYAFLFSAPWVPPEKLAQISLELGCGHRVVLAMRDCAILETLEGTAWRPWEYWAIQIYIAGDLYDNRLRKYFEFREGIEFERGHVADIWAWLEELASNRQIFQFNGVDDLLDHICDHLAHHFTVEDMVAHLERLPELYIPFIFDQWDDSLSNDQEDRSI